MWSSGGVETPAAGTAAGMGGGQLQQTLSAHAPGAPQKHNLWAPGLGWTHSGQECATFPSPVGALELCPLRADPGWTDSGQGLPQSSPAPRQRHSLCSSCGRSSARGLGRTRRREGCSLGLSGWNRGHPHGWLRYSLTTWASQASVVTSCGAGCALKGTPLPVSDLDTQPHPLSWR